MYHNQSILSQLREGLNEKFGCCFSTHSTFVLYWSLEIIFAIMAQGLSGADLKKRIAEILKDADLETTSAKKVRMQLEEDTKTDLTSRKEEIGKLIQEVIDDMEDEEEEDEEETR